MTTDRDATDAPPPVDNTATRAATAAGLARDEVAKAKDLRQFKWETRGLYLVAIALAAIVFGQNGRISDVVGQIQTERARNTLTACQRDDRANAAIRKFVRDTIPPERLRAPDVKAYLDAVARHRPIPAGLIRSSPIVAYLDRAARTFPDLSCQREVRERVRGDRP